jgi:hypothetical protein
LRLNYIISIFICIFISCSAFTQTYNYSYSDPCTGNIKTIVVPINGNVSVGYYGEIGSFSYDDFTDGTFEQWANNIFVQYGQDSPCAQIVGIGTAVTVTQNTTFNVVGILNSLSTIAEAASSGASNILGGSVSSIGNTGGDGSNQESKNGNGNSNNNSNGASNNSGNGTVTSGGETTGQENGGTVQGSSSEAGSTGSTETSSTETGSGESTTGSSESTSGSEGTSTESGTTSETSSETTTTGSGEGGGETGSGGEATQETQTTESGEGQTEGKSNITGTATTTTKNAPSKSEGGKPSVVASSDFVGFNFRNSEVRTGAKATGGYTAMRWDGKRSYGALADYTTALKGPNITCFYAWIGPKAITLLSGTATIGFDGNKSLYGTIAAGQMFNFKKVKSLKVVYMATASYGHIFREQFVGTAMIAGAMYDMKLGKRVDIKLMNLMVYAPYVSYYNDIVLASPYVMLPSIGTNLKLSKKFKFNINAGGAWDLKTAALNYTVTCGTRIMIGQ